MGSAFPARGTRFEVQRRCRAPGLKPPGNSHDGVPMGTEDGTSPAEPPWDCDSFRDALRSFLHGGASAEERRCLRGHAPDCEVCAEAYREGVEWLGRLAKERVRPGEARPRPRILSAFAGSSKKRNRLRLALWPAVVFFTLLQVDRMRARGSALELYPGGGVIEVNGEPLDTGPGAPEVWDLAGGSWVASGAEGTARIESHRAEVEVGSGVLVGLERAWPLRLRLERGTLWIEGEATVGTPRGIVELEGGRSRVAVGERGLELECESGGARWLDARGERVLGAGESVAGESLDLARNE